MYLVHCNVRESKIREVYLVHCNVGGGGSGIRKCISCTIPCVLYSATEGIDTKQNYKNLTAKYITLSKLYNFIHILCYKLWHYVHAQFFDFMTTKSAFLAYSAESSFSKFNAIKAVGNSLKVNQFPNLIHTSCKHMSSSIPSTKMIVVHFQTVLIALNFEKRLTVVNF